MGVVVVMSMSMLCCWGPFPRHCREVGEDKGWTCHHHQGEEEGEGTLVVVVVVACEGGRVRTRHG